MSRKIFSAELIISKLREAEVHFAQGIKTPQVCKKFGISDETCNRYKKETVSSNA